MLVYWTWLAGGAMTGTGAPKSANAARSRYVVTPLACAVVVTRRRTCPCWSTYAIPVTDHRALRRAVNAYRAPVQPAPEAGPASRTVAPDRRSTPSSSVGLTGQSVT